MAPVACKTLKSKELVLYPDCLLLGREEAQKMLVERVKEKHRRARGGGLIRTPACDKMPAVSHCNRGKGTLDPGFKVSIHGHSSSILLGLTQS